MLQGVGTGDSEVSMDAEQFVNTQYQHLFQEQNCLNNCHFYLVAETKNRGKVLFNSVFHLVGKNYFGLVKILFSGVFCFNSVFCF